MKRRAPRRLKEALEAVTQDAAPAGVLARAQQLWPSVAGEVVAAESAPAAERDGVLTVRCRSAVWAQELELLGPDLRTRLNAAMGPEAGVRELRFTVTDSRSGARAARDP